MAMAGRDEFPAFPFEPYPIQMQLMSAVYAALQKGGVAIVESPTGTGKTLSLICSVLQWLEEQQSVCSTVRDAQRDISDEPDWMQEFSASRNQVREKKERLVTKENHHRKEGKSKPNFFGAQTVVEHKRKSQKNSSVLTGDEDAEFLLEDYDSDNASTTSVTKRKHSSISSDSGSGTEDEEEEEPLKVFFCSRTHSQLSQFIGELKRTRFSKSMRVISLGSRKTLCINKDVLKLGSASRINDRCLELQKKSTSQKVVHKLSQILVIFFLTMVLLNGDKKIEKLRATGCAFLRKQKLQKQFKEQVLVSEPLDIEDLADLGQKIGTCPYYGSRRLIRMADVVVLPYQSLLHAATRQSLGVNLKDSVVIFDEAHNLVDTVTNTYSCQLSALQLRQVQSQLSQYLERFKNRLAPGNRRYIQILLVLIQSFLQRLSKKPTQNAVTATANEIMTINDFVFSLGIDNINLFKLCRYIKESNIANKVSSYGDKYLMQQTQNRNEKPGQTGTTAGFHALADFIQALTTAQTDGRVLLIPRDNEDVQGQFKFLMLDAEKHFSEVVEQARTVILAGGTLQPVTELRQRLLFHVPEDDIHLFSCGHIVPGESILPLAIAKGPSGKTFNFTYQSRNSPEMIEELGRLIVNISSIVPEGIVVFFPSFEYEAQVHKSWDNSGMLASILKKKQVFREPRNPSAMEAVLQEYKSSVTAVDGKGRGAVLFSVVGGKMSEGINFSDGMGRCVVMVGLPYPSPSDPELIERLKYVDQLGSSSSQGSGDAGISALQQCGQRGKEYYENLCMKAVNQSIGRAIRHIGDYAAILLLDARYTCTNVEPGRGPASKLPGWIKERLVVITRGFGEVHRLMHGFFKHNKEKISC